MVRALSLLFLVACSPTADTLEGDSPLPGGTVVTPDPTGGTNPTGTTGGTSSTTGTTGSTGDCPAGVICVESLPFVDDNTTTGAPATLDGYGCDPGIDESGSEIVYRVDVPRDGFFTASLYDLPAGVDVDVHLLEQADVGRCIDRGHWDAAALLTAGTYWVVVDSWVDASGVAHDGDYTLELNQVGYDDYVADGLTADVLEKGLRAFDRAWAEGSTSKLVYAIMDYTLPSTTERMFVLDLHGGDLLFHLHATHGSGSQDPNDITMAANLSNIDGSHASSMGLVRAAEPYYGSNGYSLRLDGLEPGFNDADRSRAIVIHGADYATEDFVNAYGYLGRSWGCPAVDPDANAALIATLEDGGLLLKYWSDPSWLATSAYVAP